MTTQPPRFVEQAAERMSRTDGHLAALLLRPRRPDLGTTSPPDLADPSPPVPSSVEPPRSPTIDEPPAVKASAAVTVDAATLKSAGMIDWMLNRGRLSEEFRVVQGQLLQVMAATEVKPPAFANVVMVTSSKPGEGKTFSSLNLAGSLVSCSRKPVILVDWDLQRPALSNRLGISKRPGLLNLLSEPDLAPGDLLVDTGLPLLRVMPVGIEREGPRRAAKPSVDIVRQLGEHYADCTIVLDTPSCLSSSDPSRLATMAGFIVMIVQAQQTQTGEVEAALDLVDACPSVMLLLNKLQLTGSDTFGAYDR